MDWNRIEGNWKQFSGMIREKWGEITDDELDKMEGKREQLEGKLQEKYGMGKEAVKKTVDDWLNTLG
ncbi:CsbD family protein [Methylocystis sp. WRRC1]|uniref:CsbD family protein n=1 Tax=Methylocystis sp. WRRC1 TaxID=1732014 RepID=UPI001D136BD3|nr:CsbD family protein [Methylocystis sp. WRRC1]MCC3245330.1 CsbD family protein [Methylocystis sp. WRRC1]